MDISQERRFQWIVLIFRWVLIYQGLLVNAYLWAQEPPSVTAKRDGNCYEYVNEKNGHSLMGETESTLHEDSTDLDKGCRGAKLHQLDKNQRLRNQEVLDHLYNNIKLYDSGVLNYDKKIN